MSLSKSLTRMVFITAALLSVAVVSGCSGLRPVYGSGSLAAQPMLDLAFAKPNSRLEQVVYEELSLRFGESNADTAPLASVRITQSVASSAMSRTENLRKPVEITVTVALTITPRDGSGEAVTFTRRATANYTRSAQVISDNAAAAEAAERAAKAAAESLRLAILAEYSR